MPAGDQWEDTEKELDLIAGRVERVLAQKAWDDTVNVVLRATVTPAHVAGGPSWPKTAADFAVSVADHVAAARQLRIAVAEGAKVPPP